MQVVSEWYHPVVRLVGVSLFFFLSVYNPIHPCVMAQTRTVSCCAVLILLLLFAVAVLVPFLLLD